MQFLKYTQPTKTEDPRGASRDASERLVPPLHLLLFPFLYLRTSVLLKDRTLRPWEVAPAATSLTPPPPSLDQASSSNTKDSLESVLVSACLYFFLYVCVFFVWEHAFKPRKVWIAPTALKHSGRELNLRQPSAWVLLSGLYVYMWSAICISVWVTDWCSHRLWWH